MRFFSKPLEWLIAFVIVLFIGLVVISMLNLERRTEECNEKNGIMARTVEGWRCIDAKILIQSNNP
jgi:hypothetical protein